MLNYRVLVIKNKIKFDISDALLRNKEFFIKRTPLNVEYDYLEGQLEPKLRPFGITDKDGNMLYGLDGLREYVTKMGVKGINYNAIVFLYDLDAIPATPVELKGLRHWTHWEPVQGAALIEIATSQKFGWLNPDLYRVFTHELLHAYHKACRLNGIPSVDTMDLYDKEYEVEAVDGNRARNIKELAEEWSWVPHQPYLWAMVLNLRMQIEALLNKQISMKKEENLDSMMLAIRRHEGWYEGSRSHRNNNPGNFKISPVGYRAVYGTVGKDDKGFAIFPTYKQGWLYLKNFLLSVAMGTSSTYNNEAKRGFGLVSSKGLSLEQFFIIYCEDDPLTPENDPIVYSKTVARAMGVDPSAKLKDLIA